MSHPQVEHIALRDISAYIKERYPNVKIYAGKWVVTTALLATKEIRRLNKELGLDKINYFGCKMARH